MRTSIIQILEAPSLQPPRRVKLPSSRVRILRHRGCARGRRVAWPAGRPLAPPSAPGPARFRGEIRDDRGGRVEVRPWAQRSRRSGPVVRCRWRPAAGGRPARRVGAGPGSVRTPLSGEWTGGCWTDVTVDAVDRRGPRHRPMRMPVFPSWVRRRRRADRARAARSEDQFRSESAGWWRLHRAVGVRRRSAGARCAPLGRSHTVPATSATPQAARLPLTHVVLGRRSWSRVISPWSPG